MRLIDADAVKLPKGFFEIVTNVPRFYEWLDTLPTIDAVPVVHGEWVLDLRGNWACSVCGNDPYHYNMENMNYCPNCGAKMDGGEDDGAE